MLISLIKGGHLHMQLVCRNMGQSTVIQHHNQVCMVYQVFKGEQ
jgi:hypothetical protein